MEKRENDESSLSLKQLIEASAILCGQKDDKQTDLNVIEKQKEGESESTSLSKRLKWRLTTFLSRVCPPDQEELPDNIASLQASTGKAALYALQLIHSAILRPKIEQHSTSSTQSDDVPQLGSRDLQTIKILLGIINSWTLGLEISAYDRLLTEQIQMKKNVPKLQEIRDDEDEVPKNADLISNLQETRSQLWNSLSKLNAILTNKENSRDFQTLHSSILEACSVHILAGGIRVGWGPIHLQKAPQQQDEIAKESASMIVQLLKRMSTSNCLKTISAIAHVGKTFQFIKSTSEMLFSAQLIRPDGVMALLRNTFVTSTDDSEERGLMKKLVSVGHLLTTPPPRMPLKVYASIIVPRLLEVLSELPDQEYDGKSIIPSSQSSQSQKNAACFALTRLYDVIPTQVFELVVQHSIRFINPSLADKSLLVTHEHQIANESQIAKSLHLITEIIDQSEPSSKLASHILETIAVQLFVLYGFVKSSGFTNIQSIKVKGKKRQSDQIAEIAFNLLITWLRLATLEESVRILSPLRKGVFSLSQKPLGTLSYENSAEFNPMLKRNDSGNLQIVWIRNDVTNDEGSSLSLKNLSLKDLDSDIILSEDNKDDIQSLPNEFINSLNLFPSPEFLSQLLKRSERKIVASSIVVDLLDAYTISKSKAEQTKENSDTLISDILYVQHIVQLIDTFGNEILQNQPEKVLIFIAFALGERSIDKTRSSKDDVTEESIKKEEMEDDIPFIKAKKDTNMSSPFSDLLNIQTRDDDLKDMQLESNVKPNDTEEDVEMIETALNLLLSLLEGDTKMTFESHSMLKVINAKVNNLTLSENESIRSLAKEASLVLKARRSTKVTMTSTLSMSQSTTKFGKAIMKGNEMYQEALKLLQDPILPVRAHGLIVLKELVSHESVDKRKAAMLSDDDEGDNLNNSKILLDSALIPAILDIFIQAICDDESFLYLNAVKGLAEMANSGGKMMIKRLISIYLGEDEIYSKTSTKPLNQLEIDKRLRIGEALLQVIQKLDLALTAYTNEIVLPILNAIKQNQFSTTYRSSMISILGTCIEACPKSMSIQGHSKLICDGMLDLLSIEMDTKSSNTNKKQVDDALSMDTKLPQLRRAALLLLSLLIRGSSLQLQDFQQRQQSENWQEELPKISKLRLPGGGSISPIKIISSDLEKDKTNSLSENMLLFMPNQIQKTETVVGYLAQFDRDALTQHQAIEVLEDLETFKLYIVHSSVTQS